MLTYITVSAKPDEIFLAEEEIKRLCRLFPIGKRNSDEKKALDLLYGTLGFLRNDFSRNIPLKTSEDNPYCMFCYRDAIFGSNTCHDHCGHKRTQGKYHFDRYRSLRIEAKNRRWFDDIINAKNYLPLTRIKLLEKGVPTWTCRETAKTEEWIDHVLDVLDVCAPIDRNKVVEKIMYSEEKFNLTRFDASWPSAMKGTMFRHEVYLLANLSYPSETVVKRLNYFWSGKLVSDLVSECGISKQAIYASIRKWEENIQELRAIGVRDDVIKHVYKIRVMPPLFDKLP